MECSSPPSQTLERTRGIRPFCVLSWQLVGRGCTWIELSSSDLTLLRVEHGVFCPDDFKPCMTRTDGHGSSSRSVQGESDCFVFSLGDLWAVILMVELSSSVLTLLRLSTEVLSDVFEPSEALDAQVSVESCMPRMTFRHHLRPGAHKSDCFALSLLTACKQGTLMFELSRRAE